MKKFFYLIFLIGTLCAGRAEGFDIVYHNIIQKNFVFPKYSDLSIRVDSFSGDVYVTIQSTVSYVIEWSPDLIHWGEMTRLYIGNNELRRVVYVDRRWAQFYSFGFYRYRWIYNPFIQEPPSPL